MSQLKGPKVSLRTNWVFGSFSDNFSKYRVLSIWMENVSQTFHVLQFV